MAEESLEEMVRKLDRNLPRFIDLKTFENRTIKIIHKYDSTAFYTSTGGHSKGRKIEFRNKDGGYTILRVCEMQRGSESVISTGVFNGELVKLAGATDIPQDHLAVYIKGSGNLYKKIVKLMEAKYGI